MMTERDFCGTKKVSLARYLDEGHLQKSELDFGRT